MQLKEKEKRKLYPWGECCLARGPSFLLQIMQIYVKRSRTRLHSPQRSLPSLHLSIPGTDRSIDLVASLSSAPLFSYCGWHLFFLLVEQIDWRNDGGLRLSFFLSRPSCPDFILTWGQKAFIMTSSEGFLVFAFLLAPCESACWVTCKISRSTEFRSLFLPFAWGHVSAHLFSSFLVLVCRNCLGFLRLSLSVVTCYSATAMIATIWLISYLHHAFLLAH